MPRTSLLWLLSLTLALLASDAGAQDTATQSGSRSGSATGAQAGASKDSSTNANAAAKAADKAESKAEAKPPAEPPIPLPEMLVVGKIDALCATDQYLVRIRPFGPIFPGMPPCPPWLLVDSKKTPQAPALLLKAAEENWTVAVYYNPTWTVTAICVRFFPRDGD